MKKIKFDYVICTIFSLIFLLPLVFIFTNSFMNDFDIFDNYMRKIEDGYTYLRLIPNRITFHQYYDLLFKSQDFINSFWNSVIITSTICILNLIFSYYVSYALFSDWIISFQELYIIFIC